MINRRQINPRQSVSDKCIGYPAEETGEEIFLLINRKVLQKKLDFLQAASVHSENVMREDC
jgi:hypothetical protein